MHSREARALYRELLRFGARFFDRQAGEFVVWEAQRQFRAHAGRPQPEAGRLLREGQRQLRRVQRGERGPLVWLLGRAYCRVGPWAKVLRGRLQQAREQARLAAGLDLRTRRRYPPRAGGRLLSDPLPPAAEAFVGAIVAHERDRMLMRERPYIPLNEGKHRRHSLRLPRPVLLRLRERAALLPPPLASLYERLTGVQSVPFMASARAAELLRAAPESLWRPVPLNPPAEDLCLGGDLDGLEFRGGWYKKEAWLRHKVAAAAASGDAGAEEKAVNEVRSHRS